MRFSQIPALLPAGLRDLLPPESIQEARLIAAMTGFVASHGYELVKPPLVEFEETLLSGSGQSLARQTFRLMDPLSQRMMALRRDMTLQIARIAGSRLGNSPRPLRLAYSGEVLRVSGTQLYPERQFCQVGCELIGSDTVEADAEIVLLATECLHIAGIKGVSVDLNLPTLVSMLVKAYGLEGAAARQIYDAAANRDPRLIKSLGGDKVELFETLIQASGPVETALPILAGLKLPVEIDATLTHLRRTIDLIRRDMPDLMLTVDPLERRGFEYHQAMCFTLFVQSLGEVGRGGRYCTSEGEGAESATGFTILTDNILEAIPAYQQPERVYCPADMPADEARALRKKGYVTIRALAHAEDMVNEARRLNCLYYWQNKLRSVG